MSNIPDAPKMLMDKETRQFVNIELNDPNQSWTVAQNIDLDIDILTSTNQANIGGPFASFLTSNLFVVPFVDDEEECLDAEDTNAIYLKDQRVKKEIIEGGYAIEATFKFDKLLKTFSTHQF